MRIWLDILTPKQAYFLGELERRLEAKGHDVFKTTRHYQELNQILEMKGINAIVVGKHGGSTLEAKLLASAQRIEGLTRIISKLSPDLSIAFASPEAARTAYGLGIPHYTINDSPHSVAVARLTIPLAKKLFAPTIIPIKTWIPLGADPNMIVQYNSLDPIAWLKTFVPNPSVLTELELDSAEPIVVFRTEEAFASYLLGHVSETESVITPIINKFLDENTKPVQVIALPRYPEQRLAIRAAFNNRVKVPKGAIDGPSLLFFSSVFIGAGGTMTAESSLLGIPTISCYPGEPTLIEKYLIRMGLVSRITSLEKAVRKLIKIIDDVDSFRTKQQEIATKLISKMGDPLEPILRTMEGEHSSIPSSVA